MNLGQRISALRNRKRLTQDQVAEALGVKRARYNAWENSISNPDHVMLGAIARFHGVTVDFLLGLPHPEGVLLLGSDAYADGYTDESFFEDLEKELERNHKSSYAPPEELEPEIRAIQRAAKNMSSNDKKKMLNMIKVAFEEAFEGDDDDKT